MNKSSVLARLTKLLGQSTMGTAFGQFLTEFGAEAIIESARYTFPKLGVMLVVIDELVEMILIHIDTSLTQEGIMCPYRANLPNDINPEDEPETIEEKLSVPPSHSERPSVTGLNPKEFRDSYELGPFILGFYFSTNPVRLSSVTIGKKTFDQGLLH